MRAVKYPRVMACKGVARGAALIGTPTAVDVTLGGKRLRRGVKVFTVAGSIAKLELYNNLRKHMAIDEDGHIDYPAGYVHLPRIDAEYLQQLCAEQLVTRRDRNGFPVREWQKLRERNEGIDCYTLARAAAAAAGLDRFEDRHWQALERQLGIAAPSEHDKSTASTQDASEPGELNVSGRRPPAPDPRQEPLDELNMSVIEGIFHNLETGRDERRPLACDDAGRLLASAESARPASRVKVFAIGSVESEAQVNTVPVDLGAGHPYGLLIARKSGVASPNEGIAIQSSIYGERWLPAAGVTPNDHLARYAPEGGADIFTVQGRPIGRFVRLVFRNGAAPQTELVLELAAWAGT